jgi:hypothetical protein
LNKNDYVKQQPQTDYEDTVDNIDNKYGHGNCNMSDIESMAKEMISSLPVLDRNKLRDEMEAMHVTVYSDPTTFNINEGLAKSQGYKERLAGILAYAQREYQVRNKVFEMLCMANNVISKAGSADKRKGEAVMKYPTFYISLEAAETFANEVKMFLDNMKSTGDAISRQASVLQAQIAIGDIHKKSDTNTSVWENGNAAVKEAEEIYSKEQNEKIIEKSEPVKQVSWNDFQ